MDIRWIYEDVTSLGLSDEQVEGIVKLCADEMRP